MLDEVDITTYELVKDYKWSQGSQTVNIHRKHAGVFGQWIQTWIPEDPTSQHKVSCNHDIIFALIEMFITVIHVTSLSL